MDLDKIGKIASTLGSIGSVVNPLVGGAVALGGSLLQNRAQKKESETQRQWNEQMMDKQNDFSLNMWNKTNEYNSPENQRQRLLDAGINPLSTDMSNQPATALESASLNSYTMPQIQNPLQNAVDTALAVRGQQAQIDYTNALTKKTEVDTDISAIALQYQTDTYGNRLKASDFELEGQRLNNEKTKTEIAKTQNDIDLSIKNYELELDKFDFNKEVFDWQKAQDLISNYFTEQRLDLDTKRYVLAQWQTAIQSRLADSTIESNRIHNLYVDAQTGTVKIANERESAQLEADKPLMKANAYIDSGLRVVDGLLSVTNISNLIKGKKPNNKSTETYTVTSDGKKTRTHTTEVYD